MCDDAGATYTKCSSYVAFCPLTKVAANTGQPNHVAVALSIQSVDIRAHDRAATAGQQYGLHAMVDELSPSTSGLTLASVDASRSAMTTVSALAQASITAVPKLTGMPSWYAPIQASVDTAQKHSRTWLETICPAVSGGVPQAIVDFNSTFQTCSGTILSTIDAIGNSTPTPTQKSTISGAFTELLNAAKSRAKSAASVTKELTQYNADLVGDVRDLGTAIGTLEQHLADGNQYVQKIKSVIGDKFIDVESPFGPCNVIVMVNIDIQVKVTTVGAPQQAIAIVLAQALVDALDENVKNSMAPLQIVLDSWGTLQAKIAAVISDVSEAEGEYVNILRDFDINAAQLQWNELATYAKTLLPRSGF